LGAILCLLIELGSIRIINPVDTFEISRCSDCDNRI